MFPLCSEKKHFALIQNTLEKIYFAGSFTKAFVDPNVSEVMSVQQAGPGENLLNSSCKNAIRNLRLMRNSYKSRVYSNLPSSAASLASPGSWLSRIWDWNAELLSLVEDNPSMFQLPRSGG